MTPSPKLLSSRLRPPLLVLLLAAALLAPARAEPALPDFDSFAILKAGSGDPKPVGIDQAAAALARYDVIFLGEEHDQIANHLAEMALFRALAARAPDIALSLEPFERDVQPVLDDYLAGRIGEASLKAKGRAWDNYDEAYRPLVEFAKEHHLPVIAANAPARLVRCVAQQGAGFLASLPAGQRGWAAAEIHADDGPYKDKFRRFLGGDAAHGGPPGAGAEAAAERSFAAQATRDDTMAESIAAWLAAHPGGKLVHVTGAFHVEDRLGTIERLTLRAPQLKIALVLPLMASGAVTADAMAGADFAILLRPEPQAYVSDAERQAAEDKEASNIRAAVGAGCQP